MPRSSIERWLLRLVVLSLALIGFIWQLQYAPDNGFLNSILGRTSNGSEINWLGDPSLNIWAVIIAFGLIVQGVAVWKLRHALRWRRLWPFLLGAALGVPVGVAVLGL